MNASGHTDAVKARVYAGVLGKIFGVYYGRPVEGWAYKDIQDRFGTIRYFPSSALGVPLIVPDDDISGTFVFARAAADAPDPAGLTAADVAEAWRNYIVENKTVLWWGGLSRSTEHTAFLRLKAGISPPASGSIQLNGRSMAEQVGAQIFIDSWALLSPGDPERAAALARAAASVSHDGLAVDASAFLAAMESMAFHEHDADRLIDDGLAVAGSPRLHDLVHATRDQCRRSSDWREVRDWIETSHGYERYPSNSPIQTNHAAIIMSLLMGGDSWQKSVEICTSAGWDTDSNAGNVGCLNGIRLGLAGFDDGPDFRAAVADRMFAVSSDGGEAITDAVRETRKLLAAAARIRGEPPERPAPRFAFELPGSIQGFRVLTRLDRPAAAADLGNPDGNGLRISYTRLAPGLSVEVATGTSVEPRPLDTAGTSYFDVVGSPTLYSGQTVRARLRTLDGPATTARIFLDHYDDTGILATTTGAAHRVGPDGTDLCFPVPDLNGATVHRAGIELTSGTTASGTVLLVSMDWSGAPERYTLRRSYEMTPGLTPWTTDTAWLRTFVSSAVNLAPDYTTTFCVSHPGRGGVVTTGTAEWDDYTVSSRIQFNQQDGAGLVARARGHRNYYSAELRIGRLMLLRTRAGVETVLAARAVDHEVDEVHQIALTVDGTQLTVTWDGSPCLHATDGTFTSGGAGFVVHSGAFLADGFQVAAPAHGEEPSEPS